MEALKLQVATLRRTNAQLSRELAALGAQQARAARTAALERLTQLQLEGGGAAAGAASQAPAAAQAAAAALQAELGVALPPGSEAVPLQYLERLHASYQARLGELQAAQAAALDQQRQEHEAALRRQVGAAGLQCACGRIAPGCIVLVSCTSRSLLRPPPNSSPAAAQSELHEREAALLADAAEDPAREAEVALLRDDCAYLKARLRGQGSLSLLVEERWLAWHPCDQQLDRQLALQRPLLVPVTLPPFPTHPCSEKLPS